MKKFELAPIEKTLENKGKKDTLELAEQQGQAILKSEDPVLAFARITKVMEYLKGIKAEIEEKVLEELGTEPDALEMFGVKMKFVEGSQMPDLESDKIYANLKELLTERGKKLKQAFEVKGTIIGEDKIKIKPPLGGAYRKDAVRCTW